MNTITPLMRVILEALDNDAEGFSHGNVACLVAARLPDVAEVVFNAALDSLCSHGLIEQVTVTSPSGALIGRIYKLTDAGCDALWALQKADAVSASFVGVDTASGLDKGIRVTFANGAMIDFVDTNHAPLTGYPNPVRDHDASNPARDGELVWQPGQPRVDDGVRPVRFNSRDELRTYTSGAKA